MRPTVLIGKEDDPVRGSPAEVRPAVGRRDGALERFGRFPKALRRSRRRVAGPDLPRIGPWWQQRVRRAAGTRQPHVSDTSTVGRPAGRSVARERRREPGDRGAVIRVYADERVIAAIRDEREPGPVGRPTRVAVLAARREQRLGGCAGKRPARRRPRSVSDRRHRRGG